jgi:RES domain-containing protein
MLVYRITLEKYAGSLVASGNAARWNSKDVSMIYTASSRSLACLENIVHRTHLGSSDIFRVMVISIPDSMKIERISLKDLHPGWNEFDQYPYTRSVGDQWISEGRSAILSVPSAIIQQEENFLLNPAHKDFRKITLEAIEPFAFDTRILH